MSATPVNVPSRKKPGGTAPKRAKVDYMSSPHDVHVGKMARAMASEDVAHQRLCKRYGVEFDSDYIYGTLQEYAVDTEGSRLPEAEAKGWEVCVQAGHNKNFYVLRMSKDRAAALAAEEYELDRQSRTSAGAIMGQVSDAENVQGTFAKERVTDKSVTVQGSEPA